MAGVSGTELIYKRESKLGLTTLTFRKRRYMFPSVIVKGDQSMSASTGALESTGKCVMLDVGMFCPHCAGSISARLSGSHSKLVITKGNGTEHQCADAIRAQAAVPQLEYSCTSDSSPSAGQTQTISSNEAAKTPKSKQAKIKKIKTESGTTDDTISQATRDSLDSSREQSQKETVDVSSSSDYESLDRDSCVNSVNSHGNSTDMCVSVTSCGGGISSPKVDEAYHSLASSYHSNTPEPPGYASQQGLTEISPFSSKYSSLPRDVGLSSNGYSSSEERLVLDSMQVDVSDANDEVLIDELLNDEVIDEEYHSLMSGSMTKSTSARDNTCCETSGDNQARDSVSDDSFEVSRSEDNLSNRSASPEVFVDDILENMDSEIISGDATLPRVFSLQKGVGIKRHIPKQKRRQEPIYKQVYVEGVEVDSPKRKPRPGEIIVEGSASIQRRKLRDLVKTKYKNVQKNIKFTSQQKTDFTHENFFEEVMEALTDLEGGFTEWADNDSDSNDIEFPKLEPHRAKFIFCDNDDENDKDTLDVYNIPRKTATSSCECMADDRSGDLDSSLEHIPSTLQTPSEASTLDGEGSSSDCSYSGVFEPMHDDGGLFKKMIQETQTLTDELLIANEKPVNVDSFDSSVYAGLVRPDKRISPMRDQCDIIDEVFVGDSPDHWKSTHGDTAKLEYQNLSTKPNIPADVVRPAYANPTRITPYATPELSVQVEVTNRPFNTLHSTGRDHPSHEIDVDSSFENLLTCNDTDGSNSDLDEPLNNELYHAGLLGEKGISKTSHEDVQQSDISDDFQKCLLTNTTEVDEFVPETEPFEMQPEILKHVAQYAVSHLGSHNLPKSSSHDDDESPVEAATANVDDGQNKFDSTVQSGEWKNFVNESDTKVATFESKDNMSKDQAQEFMKYVLSQSSQTHHSKEHSSDLDACLDQVCQTCEFKPKNSEEIVKNEEVITKEVTLVFAWPKKMKIGRPLKPKVPGTKPAQPFRTIHLRRVMRVSDFDTEVIEGPTIETVEYRNDGSTKKSISKGATQKSVNLKDKKVEDGEKGSPVQMLKTDCLVTKIESNETSDVRAGDFGDEFSGHSRVNDGNSDIVKEELSHYMTVQNSFTMPELDVLERQRSELLFDMSSSVSREFLSDTENDVDLVYEDHKRAMDEIYKQALCDTQCVNSGIASDFETLDSGDSVDDALSDKDTLDLNSTAKSKQQSNDQGGKEDIRNDTRLVITSDTEYLQLIEQLRRCSVCSVSRSKSTISDNINMNKPVIRSKLDSKKCNSNGPQRKQKYQINKYMPNYDEATCLNCSTCMLNLKTDSPLDQFLFEGHSRIRSRRKGNSDVTKPPAGASISTPSHTQHDAMSLGCPAKRNAATQTSLQYDKERIAEYCADPTQILYTNECGCHNSNTHKVVDPLDFNQSVLDSYLCGSSRHKRKALRHVQLPESTIHDENDVFWNKYLFGNEQVKSNPNMFKRMHSNMCHRLGEQVHKTLTHEHSSSEPNIHTCRSSLQIPISGKQKCANATFWSKRNIHLPITNAKPVRYFCCRESTSVPGKDPQATFIEQAERNVLLVDAGKYFTVRPLGLQTDQENTMQITNNTNEGVHVGETICPRCADAYIIDDTQTSIRRSQTEFTHEQPSTKRQHPEPCERCIRLEREIKIKLEELTAMVEEISRRKTLGEDKGKNINSSIDDLESMSKETVNNIKILQRSIASLQNVKSGDHKMIADISQKARVISYNAQELATKLSLRSAHGISKDVNNVSEIIYPESARCTTNYLNDGDKDYIICTSTANDVQDDLDAAPVNYSTRVVKKKKQRKVTRPEDSSRDDGTCGVTSMDSSYSCISPNSDISTNVHDYAFQYSDGMRTSSSYITDSCIDHISDQQLDAAAIEQDAVDASDSMCNVDVELQLLMQNQQQKRSHNVDDVIEQCQSESHTIMLDHQTLSTINPNTSVDAIISLKELNVDTVVPVIKNDEQNVADTFNILDNHNLNSVTSTEHTDIHVVTSIISHHHPELKSNQLTDEQNLDIFAENLSKYILFRAKLSIILENPTTRIHCLRNEQIVNAQNCPDKGQSTKPTSPSKGSSEKAALAEAGIMTRSYSDVSHGASSGVHSIRNQLANGNASGADMLTNIFSGGVSVSRPTEPSHGLFSGRTIPSHGFDQFSPEFRERVADAANIQAQLELNMRKIHEKMEMIKSLQEEQETKLHADFDPTSDCPTYISPVNCMPSNSECVLNNTCSNHSECFVHNNASIDDVFLPNVDSSSDCHSDMSPIQSIIVQGGAQSVSKYADVNAAKDKTPDWRSFRTVDNRTQESNDSPGHLGNTENQIYPQDATVSCVSNNMANNEHVCDETPLHEGEVDPTHVDREIIKAPLLNFTPIQCISQYDQIHEQVAHMISTHDNPTNPMDSPSSNRNQSSDNGYEVHESLFSEANVENSCTQHGDSLLSEEPSTSTVVIDFDTSVVQSMNTLRQVIKALPGNIRSDPNSHFLDDDLNSQTRAIPDHKIDSSHRNLEIGEPFIPFVVLSTNGCDSHPPVLGLDDESTGHPMSLEGLSNDIQDEVKTRACVGEITNLPHSNVLDGNSETYQAATFVDFKSGQVDLSRLVMPDLLCGAVGDNASILPIGNNIIEPIHDIQTHNYNSNQDYLHDHHSDTLRCDEHIPDLFHQSAKNGADLSISNTEPEANFIQSYDVQQMQVIPGHRSRDAQVEPKDLLGGNDGDVADTSMRSMSNARGYLSNSLSFSSNAYVKTSGISCDENELSKDISSDDEGSSSSATSDVLYTRRTDVRSSHQNINFFPSEVRPQFTSDYMPPAIAWSTCKRASSEPLLYALRPDYEDEDISMYREDSNELLTSDTSSSTGSFELESIDSDHCKADKLGISGDTKRNLQKNVVDYGGNDTIHETVLSEIATSAKDSANITLNVADHIVNRACQSVNVAGNIDTIPWTNMVAIVNFSSEIVEELFAGIFVSGSSEDLKHTGDVKLTSNNTADTDIKHETMVDDQDDTTASINLSYPAKPLDDESNASSLLDSHSSSISLSREDVLDDHTFVIREEHLDSPTAEVNRSSDNICSEVRKGFYDERDAYVGLGGEQLSHDDFILELYKNDTVLDDSCSMDDLSSVTSSEQSDASMVTVIHVPNDKQHNVESKSGQSGIRTHYNDQSEAETQRRRKKFTTGPHSVRPVSVQPLSVPCVWTKRTPHRSGLRTLSESSIAQTPVIPEGLMTGTQYTRGHYGVRGDRLRADGLNVRCLPMSNVSTKKHYYRTNAQAVMPSQPTNVLKQSVSDSILETNKNVEPSLDFYKRVQQASQCREHETEGDNALVEKQAMVQIRLHALKSGFNEMLEDVRYVKDQFQETHERHKRSISSLINMPVPSVDNMHGQRSELIHGRPRSLGQQEVDSIYYGKSLSCDAIEAKNVSSYLELATSSSDPVLRPSTGNYSLTFKNTSPILKPFLKCLSVESTIEGDESRSDVRKSDPNSDHDPPTIHYVKDPLSAERRQSGPCNVWIPGNEHLRHSGETEQLLRMSYMGDLSHYADQEPTVPSRRWSETDVEKMRQVVDADTDFLDNETAIRLSGNSLSNDETSPINIHPEVVDQSQTEQPDTSDRVPQVSSSRCVDLYGLYFQSRRAKLQRKRSKSCTSPPPDLTDTRTTRTEWRDMLLSGRRRRRRGQRALVKTYIV